MLFNSWKSVIVSWANALGVVPDRFNFINDLKAQFFPNLCTYVAGSNNVKTFRDALNYIRCYYSAIDFESNDDGDNITLVATAFLLLISIHNTNEALCTKVCNLPYDLQIQIRNVLEAFVNIPASNVTKESIFSVLAQLPECGESISSPDCYASNGTPESSGTTSASTPNSSIRRKSSRFKRIKAQLQTTMALKNDLQEELDVAREAILNLETALGNKKQEIADLKRRNQRVSCGDEAQKLEHRFEKIPSLNCSNCKALERQLATSEECCQQERLEMIGLKEASMKMSEKIDSFETLKRKMNDELQMYEEQMLCLHEEIDSLKAQNKHLSSQNLELEDYFAELKESNGRLSNLSVEFDTSENLASQIVDVELAELKLDLAATKMQLEGLLKEKEKFLQTAVNQDAALKNTITELTSLKEDIQRKDNFISQLEVNISELETSIHSLYDSTDHKDTEITLQNSGNNSAVSVVQLVKHKIQQQDTLLSQLGENLKLQTEEKYKLIQEKLQCNVQLDEIKAKNAHLLLKEKELEIMTEKYRCLNNELEGKENYISQIEKNTSALEERNNQLLLAAEVLKLQVVELVNDCFTLTAKYHSVLEQKDEMITIISTALSSTNEDIWESFNDISNINNNLQIKVSIVEELSDNIQKLTQEKTHLTSKLCSTEKQLKIREESIDLFASQIKEERLQNSERISQLSSDLQDLTTENMQVYTKLECISAQNLDLEQQVAERTKHLGQLNKQLKLITDNYEKSENNYLLLKKDLDTKNMKIADLNMHVANLNEDNSTLCSKLNQTESKLLCEVKAFECFKLETSQVQLRNSQLNDELKSTIESLTKLLESQTNCTVIYDELRVLNDKFVQSCSENTKLNTQLQRNEEEREGLGNDIIELNEETSDLRCELDDSKSLLKKNIELIDELGAKFATLTGDIKKLDAQIGETNEENEALKHELSGSKAVIVKLSEEVGAFKRELQVKTAMIDNFEVQIRQLIAENSVLNSELNDSKSTIENNLKLINELEASFEALRCVNEHTNENNASLKQSLLDTTTKCTEFQTDDQRKAALIEDLQINIAKLNEKNAALNHELMDFKSTFEKNCKVTKELEGYINDLKSHNEQTNERNVSLQQELFYTSGKLQEFQTEGHSKSELIGDLEMNIVKLIGENSTLNSELEDSKTRLEKNSKLIHELEVNIEKLECDNEETNKWIASLKKEILDTTGKLTEFQTEGQNKTELIRDLEMNIAKLNEENSALNRELMDSKIRLETNSKQIEDLEGNIDKLASDNEKINKQIVFLTQELLDTTGKLAEFKTDVERKAAIIDDLDMNISKLNEENSTLNSELMDSKSRLENNSKLIVKLEENIERLECDNGKTNVQNVVLKQELLDSTGKLAEFETDVEQKGALIDDLEMNISKLNEENSTLNSELMDYKSKLENNSKQIEELEADIVRATHEIRNLESQKEHNVCLEEKLLSSKDKLIKISEEFTHFKTNGSHQIEKLEMNIVKLNEVNSLLNSALDDSKCKLEKNLELINELNANIEMLSSNKQNLDSQIYHTKEQNIALNKSLLDSQNNLIVLSKKLAGFEIELQTKNDVIEDLETARSKLKLENDLLYSETSDTKSKLDKSEQLIVELRADIQCLTFEKEDFGSRIGKLNEENAALQQKLLDCQTNLMLLSDTLKILQGSHTKSDDSLANLKAELQRKTSKNDELEVNVLQLTKQNGILTLEQREFATKFECLTAERDRYMKKNIYFQKILDEKSSKVVQLESQLSKKVFENKELEAKLTLKSNDIERYSQELGILQKSLKNTISVNGQLEKEVQALTISKRQELSRLEKESIATSTKNKQLEAHAASMNGALRKEYDEKLERLKTKMKHVYIEKLEEQMAGRDNEEQMLKEELCRERSKRSLLEARVRELSDQLLITQEEKRSLIDRAVFKQPYHTIGAITNPAFESPNLLKSQSLDRLPISSRGMDNFGADFSLDQSRSSISSRRISSDRGSHLPKGIGKVFPAAEEEGEVFDNRCLSELKAGTSAFPVSNTDRMSILQQRNSLCPPHLKSSYPIESQFYDPAGIREDDLKTVGKPPKENRTPRKVVAAVARRVGGTPSRLRGLFRKD